MHFVYTEPVFFKDVENYVKVKLKSLHLRRYNSQFRIIKTSFHTFHRVFNSRCGEIFHITARINRAVNLE